MKKTTRPSQTIQILSSKMRCIQVTALSILFLFIIHTAFALDSNTVNCQSIEAKYDLDYDLVPMSINDKNYLTNDLISIIDLLIEADTKSNVSRDIFNKIKNDIPTITLCENQSTNLIIGSRFRNGSIYLTEEKAIIFNNRALIHDAKASYLSAVLNIMHEFYGAMGFNDHEYQITSLTYNIIHTKHILNSDALEYLGKQLNKQLNEHPRATKNHSYLALSGGVSGVGGGGDPEVIAIKAFGIMMYLSNIELFDQLFEKKLKIEDFLDFIINTTLESTAVIEKNSPNMINSFTKTLDFPKI